VRQVQVLRKNAGLQVTDAIRLAYDAEGEMAATLEAAEKELARAGRASSVSRGRAEMPHQVELEIQGAKVWIGLEKA
jgi:hypothetical protein